MILEDVRKNKIKTAIIIAFFLALVAVLVYVIAYIFLDNIYWAVSLALFLSLLATVSSYHYADQTILNLNHVRAATGEEYRQINLLLEGLCIAANIPMPRLYIMDSPALNAFAAGRDPQNSVICVTSGLLEKLDKYELEAVLAHEVSHIRNYDVMLATVAIAMVGLIIIIADIFAHTPSTTRGNRGGKGGGIVLLIGFVFVILSPIFAELIKLALSRNREYLADACAVELTRNRDGLINALQKIGGDAAPMLNANRATASLFINDPFKNNKKVRSSLWSSHPAIERRIVALINLK